MTEPQSTLFALGALLLAGLATDALGRLTPLPRVTLLLLFGIVVGPHGFDWIPSALLENFDVIASIALLMVGFLLGEKFTAARLRGAGRGVAAVVVCEGGFTAVLVAGGLLLIGQPAALAIPLACIASASAPAATLDVVAEERASGPFTDRLLEVVALDDGLSLLLFSFGIAMTTAMLGGGAQASAGAHVVHELGGALVLGVAVGVPGAYLSGRVDAGQPTLVEALGLVFVCGGLAMAFDVSFLLAAMTMGAVVANFATHHERPFHAIEGIEQPFMIIFFAVAGATLEVDALYAIGLIGTVYIICRVLGKIAGAVLGARLGGVRGHDQAMLGMALLPQAGVAMGMALVAAEQLPGYRDVILPVVIGTTIVFELIGPVFTRLALRRAGESGGVAPERPQRPPGP